MSFLESRVSFSLNFASHCNVMRHNSSILSHLKLYMLWKKGAHQSANFHRFPSADMKTNQFAYFIFKAACQFSFRSCINFQCYDIIPVKFSGCNIICFGQKQSIKAQLSRFLSALMKFTQFCYDIFDTIKSDYIKNLHRCSVSWKIIPPFCSLNAVYFGQKKLIEEIFSDFWAVGLKFTKFLMPYFKPSQREKRPNTEFFLVFIFFVFGLNTKIYCVNRRI